MINRQKIGGFTLIELIVVILILTILGTLTIVMTIGYASNTRDSKRVADIGKIVTSLHVFEAEKLYFPEPTSGSTISYSGAEAWSQGTFGEDTFKVLSKINKLTRDPLSRNNYTYSVTAERSEFQLGCVLEETGLSASIINQVNAEDLKIGLAYVRGNYNGILLKVSTGSLDYILAVPSILSTHTLLTLEQIISNKKLVYDEHHNLPHSYLNTNYNIDGGFDFTPSQLVINSFSSDRNELRTDSSKLDFLSNLQTAYSGTILDNRVGLIGDILSLDPETNQLGALKIIESLISNYIIKDTGAYKKSVILIN